MPDQAKVPRFSAPLKDDGSFDLNRMHPKNKAALVAALKAPGLADDLGLAPKYAPSEATQSHIAAGLIAGNLCQAIGMAEAIYLDRLGVPRDIIGQVAPMTEEESAAVIAPLSRVMDKYLAASLNKWGDEINLLVALTSITVTKVSRARELMARRGPRAVTTPIPIRAAETDPPPAPAAAVPDEAPSLPITLAES